MKLDIAGRGVFDYDSDAILVEQGEAIEKYIGGTMVDWESGLLNGRSDCYRALGWLLFEHGDVSKPISSVSFPLLSLANPFMAARIEQLTEIQAELDKALAEAKESEADPTLPPGPPPSPPAASPSPPAM